MMDSVHRLQRLSRPYICSLNIIWRPTGDFKTSAPDYVCKKQDNRVNIIWRRTSIFVSLPPNSHNMKQDIIARKNEIAILDSLMEEEFAQFIAVYGRRRVGKTFLIREYFGDKFTFFHTAVSPRELKDRQPEYLYRIQLDEFAKTLKLYGYQSEEPIKDWFDAFDRLWVLIQSHPQKERLVLFIDEMPWLDTPRAGFMKFCPRPPYSCLITIMANTAPIFEKPLVARHTNGFVVR